MPRAGDRRERNRRERRRGAALRRLVLVLAGLLLGLLAVELVLRATYAPPWYERLQGARLRNQTYTYRLNRLGLRDRDYPEPKPPGTRRVLLFGDSFAHGFGVPEDDRIFPALLEQLLDEDPPLPGVEHVELLNAAIPGDLTGDWVERWDSVIGFDPDVVLIVFFLRDGCFVKSVSDLFDPIREGVLERNGASLLYARSYAYRVLRDRLDRAATSELLVRRYLDAYFGSEEETAEWRRAQANLELLFRRSRERGARVGFVIFPILFELGEDYPFAPICELLADFAEAHDVPVKDLLDDFRGRDAPDLWVSPFDQHPNRRGHRIAARALLPFVAELLREAG